MISMVPVYLPFTPVVESLTVWQLLVGTLLGCVAIHRKWTVSQQDNSLPSVKTSTKPPVHPYLLPWIGHAFRLLMHAEGVFASARAFFRSSAPFSLAVPGQRLYVVSDPADIKALMRNNKTLSWAHNLREVIQLSGGLSSKGADILINNGLFTSMNAFYRSHLVRSEPLRDVAERMYAEMEAMIEAELAPSGHATGQTKRLSLTNWTRRVVFTAATNAMYGSGILERHPKMMEDFLTFDDGFYMLLTKLPHWKSFKARRAWSRMIEAFAELLQDRRRMVEEDVLPMISDRQEMFLDAGVPFLDAVRMQAGFFWATHANTLPVTLSLLTNILSNAELLQSVRFEIASCVSSATGMPDLEELVQPEICPTFHAALSETLRLASAPIQTRTVVSPTSVGGYTLEPNSRVLLPSVHLQQDESIWGTCPEEFDVSRWTKTGRDEASAYQAGVFRPFGSGSTYCPGRLLARREMLSYVALVLHSFKNLRLEGEEMVFEMA